MNAKQSSASRARMPLSKRDQTEQGEVGIQMKQSAIHWICDNKEWIGGRAKEIGRNCQYVLAVQRFIGLVRYLSKFLQTFQKGESLYLED